MFALDIETVRDETKIETLPEPEVAVGNLKDPEKIAAKIEAARSEQISRMALSPLTGRVCSYAAYGCDGFVNNITSECEAEVLTRIFMLLSRRHSNNPTICTWNGIGLDLPFVYRRALILKLDMCGAPPLAYWSKRYSTTPHADLMQVWAAWDSRQYASLDTVASNVLGEKKLAVDVHDFPNMLKTAEGRDKIREYNLRDAELTFRLYNEFNGCLF